MDQVDDHTKMTADAGLTQQLAGRFGLSAKLLVLTILFVMIAEVLIYVPSVANFRLNWLRDKLSDAYTAALVLEATPQVPEELARQVLESIGARAVAMKMGQQRRLLMVGDMPPTVDHEIDLRDVSWRGAIVHAFAVLFSDGGDVIRVLGNAPRGGEFVEVIFDERPLRAAMLQFSGNILVLSLIISAITAALVFLALHYLFVRPLYRIKTNMTAFRADPENPARVIVASRRQDEIGTTERELAGMQRELGSLLQQKNRLAALGLAVSKINHDLRNLLTSAQLFSDRLSGSQDQQVQRFAPKLMRALERAIQFCESTLSYGRAQEAPPDRRPVALEPLVAEVRESLEFAPDTPIRWIGAVERGLTVDADPDQLVRILLNLARNAVQALESRDARDPGRDQIRITGRREGAVAVIEVSDTGPGIPDTAREHLFEPFKSTSRSGGSGLGLVIVAELVRAHDGDVRLVEGTIGATFRVTIPDRPVALQARRDERASA
jgi:signal transduction histidine kinase